MKIQVWSDIMCPFCYIAKKNFEAALENSPFKNEVEVEWKSFQLDPDLKENSGTVSISEYLMKRKGFSEPQLKQFQNQLKEMGNAAGVTFNQDTTIAAETFSAHKLLHFAKENNKADAMEEALFVAHFTDGKNIADADFLVSLAEELGLDKEKARKILSEDAYDYEVKQDIMEAHNLGISGVPYYLLDNKYAVSGAQPVELFTRALAQTYQESIVNLSQTSGENMCGADGCSI
ncbi:DsbA family oxidoreductase [Myroides odoratimimus]|uniref:DsbA family oxidoreductase n=1 Tax=Myroides odoratimimus TaxID=76832 RepID=UPI003101736D